MIDSLIDYDKTAALARRVLINAAWRLGGTGHGTIMMKEKVMSLSVGVSDWHGYE
jgi:hypothetical protein